MTTAVRAVSALVVALAGVVGLAATPGGAGGSPLWFDRDLAAGEWYEPGDVAVARGGFGPGCCDRGWLEDGPWFAEVVRLDEDGSAPVDPPVPVGELRVEEVSYEVNGTRHRRYEAVVEFVVPDVADGPYVLHHCNDPCTKELGSITAGWFRIGPPPAPPVDVEAPPTPSAVPSTTTTVAEPSPAVGVRADEVTPAVVESPSSNRFPYVAGAVALVLAAALAALVLRRHRRS